MSQGLRNINLPLGTRDIVYDEAALYTDIERRLTGVFSANGFREIRTPAIEYHDVYSYEQQAIPEESMYKLTDNTGRLAVLRPDNTMPAARVIATKLRKEPLPQKLYYNQNIYRINSGYSGRRSEIIQSGVELIGAGGMTGDLICLSCAVEALKALELPFKIEIGHVGYFNALLDELDMTDEEKRQTRAFVDAKNSVSLNLSHRLATFDRIRRIPLLYGGEEVFAEAAELAAGNAGALEALNHVSRLYRMLVDAGYGEFVIVDMGIVHKIDYYTGVVFGGYIEGAGEPVLNGGRYDNLLDHFGCQAPATGFAVNVCLVADAMLKNGRSAPLKNERRCVLHFTPDCFAEAEAYKKALSEKGYLCEYSCFDSFEDTLSYTRTRRIGHIARISKDGAELMEVNAI
ncbi:MAG: ATP phosphoribosyltransferase regulatory subunit [Firmicutes bacterium]|nr:ATP phosphoribosyltransferase regulatory subunit [Bacillota bacterium]